MSDEEMAREIIEITGFDMGSNWREIEVFDEATSYVANNPERVGGRALTGVAVGTAAGAGFGSKLGVGARVIGPALGAAAAYGDIRYAVEQGRAQLEDLIKAGVGGQTRSVGPSSWL